MSQISIFIKFLLAHGLSYFESEVAQLCTTLCNPMDCLPGSSIRGILQARVLEWVAIFFQWQANLAKYLF